jgi:hypothetical protein
MADQETRNNAADDGDPLLVRPYVAAGPTESGSTWPSAAAKPSGRAPARRTSAPIALPGVPIALPGAPIALPGKSRRRVLVLAGAGVAAVVALATAGFAAFGPDDAGTRRTGAPAADPAPSPIDSISAPAVPGTSPSPSGAGGSAVAPAGAPSPAGHSTSPPATVGTTRSKPGPTTTGAETAPRSPAATLPPPPAADRVGTIVGAGNLCLDLDGAVPFDGNAIQVFVCNGSGAQSWTLAADGTLRVLGKCAQVTADATVHIIGCDLRAAAQWRAGRNRALVNVGANQCLADPQNGTRSRTAVLVAACTGAANEQWTLP